MLSSLLRPFSRHVRWKIILPFALLSFALAVAGTYLTTKVVARSLGERFDNQLVEAARSASDAFVRQEQKHLEVSRAVAFTDGVAEAAGSTDKAALERLILPIVANARTERVEIVDAAGGLVYGLQRTDDGANAYREIDSAPDYGSRPPVAAVLAGQRDARGDKFAGIAATTDGAYFYTVSPLRTETELRGAVLISTALPALLSAIKLEAMADITLYDAASQPLATSLPAADASLLAELTPSVVRDQSAVRETKRLYGRNFDLFYSTLLIRGDEPVAYSVALPTSFILTAATQTRWQMTLLFALATSAVLGTGAAVANYITRPVIALAKTAEAVSAGDLSARSGHHAQDEIGTLARTFDSMTGHLQRQHISTVQALASAIDARDPYTLGHSLRVGQLAARLGESMGLSRVAVQHLEIGGYLHDIGKIGVRDSVLLKTGALTDEERRLIEEHPIIGLKIIESIELPDAVREFVASHHERIDGTGYPIGLKEAELSVFARIGAVSDMYDALITDRPYRAAMSLNDVLELLNKEATQRHLDLSVVKALEQIAPAWERDRVVDSLVESLNRSAELVRMAS